MGNVGNSTIAKDYMNLKRYTSDQIIPLNALPEVASAATFTGPSVFADVSVELDYATPHCFKQASDKYQ